jgi:hypothetical protein
MSGQILEESGFDKNFLLIFIFISLFKNTEQQHGNHADSLLNSHFEGVNYILFQIFYSISEKGTPKFSPDADFNNFPQLLQCNVFTVL